MSPAHVLEPTYQRIRHCLTGGEWPPGFRLDTARIAAVLGVSTSPVRDSLNRLAGEHLVDFTPGDGFHVPRIDERQLRELLHLNLLLLTAAIDCETYRLPDVAREPGEAERSAWCHQVIARASRNGELMRAIGRTSDRLAPVLRHDASIIDGHAAEVAAIKSAIVKDRRDRIRMLVRRFHGTRIEKAAAYVMLLQTAGAKDTSPV